MLHLKTCTAVAVTSVCRELTAHAARRCLASCDFADLFVLTDQPMDVPWRPIEPLRGVGDYNRFIQRSLIEHVRTEHVLIFQWDGFVLDPGAWTDEFLAYDYIGAPWPEATSPPGRHVGNGGFSLRSRLLLEALLDPALDFDPSRPEDKVICRELRPQLEERHGIRFAPVELAARFSFEHLRTGAPSFGFHGDFNFPLAMPEADLLEALKLIPETVWSGDRVWKWVRQARRAGLTDLAGRLQRHCLETYPDLTRGWPGA